MMVVVHPTGNAFVRALLRSLYRHELLARYVTSLAFHREDRWMESLPTRLRGQLMRRRYDLPAALVERMPAREVVRLLAGAVGLGRWVTHETGWASIDAVQRAVGRRAASRIETMPALRGVYAYEDGAREVFVAAEHRGLSRCYDLPIGYWREAQRIFREEAELQPEWAATLDGLQDSPAKLARKDEELASASSVIVASEFTRRTLLAYPGALAAPISVVPYGAEETVTEQALGERLAERRTGLLRVLFVGGLTQRKGLSYVFSAMRTMRAAATLTVVGRGASGRCAALEGALREHTYVPSLPSGELFALMRRHDVLVLPSLFEGFGLVLLEAMAQGLPVIATPHTAAPDLFVEEAAGIIVPVRSPEALAAAIERLANDSNQREQYAFAARRIAARMTWEAYGKKLVEICGRAMMSGP
jgi:alpha-maltose-1-phosphate synthase